MATNRDEHYILHIYRRDKKAVNASLVGILEEPVSGQEWRFRTAQELGELLKLHDLDLNDVNKPIAGDDHEQM